MYPGITVEHVSPEPEDKSEDAKTTDREIKTPEGNNLSNREMVSDAKESAETETGYLITSSTSTWHHHYSFIHSFRIFL